MVPTPVILNHNPANLEAAYFQREGSQGGEEKGGEERGEEGWEGGEEEGGKKG